MIKKLTQHKAVTDVCVSLIWNANDDLTSDINLKGILEK